MTWETVCWDIPLGHPPRLAAAGLGRHGHRQVEHYRLPELWCLHLYRYTGELVINGQAFPIRHGSASVTPPDAALEYRYRGPSTHVSTHFRFPAAGADRVRIPAMQPTGPRFAELDAALLDVVGWFSTEPARANARLWDVLWQLTVPARQSPGPRGPVRQVQMLIEQRLAEALYVPDLARAVDLSHNHLTRLFRSEVGLTVVEYIRQRRLERARHLLESSTLPIKAVAAEVGWPDLHLFNKIIRQALGKSPRAWRAQPMSVQRTKSARLGRPS